MVQMNIAEAKAKLSELVARAEAGEEVVIAQALNRGLAVITADRAYGAYGVETVW